MPTMASLRYDLKRAMRWRPSPFEIMLGIGVVGFLALLGVLFLGALPSSSLGRYESSLRAMQKTTAHFPRTRAELPAGSSFYRAMHNEKIALYTPNSGAAIDALLEKWPMTMEGDARVLEEMRGYASRVLPEGVALERDGAVWGRVVAQPGRGYVWFDRDAGDVVYFAIDREDRP